MNSFVTANQYKNHAIGKFEKPFASFFSTFILKYVLRIAISWMSHTSKSPSDTIS